MMITVANSCVMIFIYFQIENVAVDRQTPPDGVQGAGLPQGPGRPVVQANIILPLDKTRLKKDKCC